jgi:hypothetical protein
MEGIMRACSSDSICELAAAMAKAQAELVNPIKSLTAVLERGRNGMGPISYRYAPLSAGLDILRKTLSKYELAAIQTTRIDTDRGLVLLTTMLAHSSGEWISGVWPVCQISDMGHPKLMGAALTYARRYCLFTMVGLAGEDDLDGPALEANDNPPPEDHALGRAAEITAANLKRSPSPTEPVREDNGGPDNAGTAVPSIEAPSSTELRKEKPPRSKRRSPRASAAARTSAQANDPIADLAVLQDPDALLRWAARNMSFRNGLDAVAREMFDAAFLTTAKAIGVEPELLIPFERQHHAAKAPNGPASPE